MTPDYMAGLTRTQAEQWTWRAAGAADNAALKTETVEKAEERNRDGWPWPVSGDATTLQRAAIPSWTEYPRPRKG